MWKAIAWFGGAVLIYFGVTGAIYVVDPYAACQFLAHGIVMAVLGAFVGCILMGGLALGEALGRKRRPKP